jgi:hypothetical protein
MNHGRSQSFATAQNNCKSVCEQEFYERYKDLVWPSDAELKRLVKQQQKKDRKTYKRQHPGKCRRWCQKLAKRLRGKPKLSFKGVKRNGNKEKFLEEISLCCARYVYAVKEYEKGRRNKKRS